MPPESSPKKWEEVRVPEVRFLGEQDGPAERLLKEKLVALFRQDNTVSEAYLARADLGDGSIGVVLALRTTSSPDEQTVENVSKVFAPIFAGSQHLEILFLTDAQECQLKPMCNPFFSHTQDS